MIHMAACLLTSSHFCLSWHRRCFGIINLRYGFQLQNANYVPRTIENSSEAH